MGRVAVSPVTRLSRHSLGAMLGRQGGFEMTSMRELQQLVVALAILALLTPMGARGDDRERLQKKLDRADAKTADLFASDARAAEKKGVFQGAGLDYRLALAFDPDHRKARDALGYSGKPGQWRLTRPSGLAFEDEASENLVEAYAARRRERGRRASRLYADIAVWCVDRGLEEASLVWRRVMSLDPDHQAARAALGYQRLGERVWVSEEDARRLGEAAAGDVAEEGPVAERTGLSLRSRAGASLSLEGSCSQADLADVLRLADLGHAIFEELFPFEEPRESLHVVLLDTEEAFGTFIEDFRPDDSDEEREAAMEFSAISSQVDESYAMYAEDQHNREDGVLGHVVAQDLEHLNAAAAEYVWLSEGLPAWFTVRLHGSAEYYTVGDDSLDPELERLASPDQWPLRVRMLVATGEATPLPGLVSTKEVNAFSADQLALGWSLIDFLVERHPAAFVTMVKSLGEGEDPVALLTAATQSTAAELQAAWHGWALERY